jgi:hypothetical protein
LAKKKIPPVLEIIRDNIVQSGNPLAISPRQNASWVKDLRLPAKGEILLYTGGEYQLLPYIDSLVRMLTFIDPSSNAFSLLLGARKLVNIAGIRAEKIFASVLAKNKKRYLAINYKAAYILKNWGMICVTTPGESCTAARFSMNWVSARPWNLCGPVAETLRKTEAIRSYVFLLMRRDVQARVPKITDFPQLNIKTFIEMVWEKSISFLSPCRFSGGYS